MKLTIEPLDVVRDARLLHAWVTHPRSKFWMMQDATLDDVRREYGEIAANPHHDAFLGRVDGRPAFLVETYDPAHSAARPTCPSCGPATSGCTCWWRRRRASRVPGYTTQVFAGRAGALLRRPGRATAWWSSPTSATRRSGSRTSTPASSSCARCAVPGKTAMLSVCTREDYERASGNTAPHLTPAFMDRAHRHLVAKAIGEYAHERLIAPVPDAERPGWWTLTAGGTSTYSCAARTTPSSTGSVDPASIRAGAGRTGLRRGARAGAGDPGPAAADVPRGDRLHPRRRRVEAAAPPGARGRAGRRGLPGDRGGDDRGPPGVRRQQRPDRVRARRLRGVRARDGRAGAAALAGRPARGHPADAGRGPDRGGAVRRRAGAGDPARGSTPGCGGSGSTRPTTCSCRCTRGSGSTSWP